MTHGEVFQSRDGLTVVRARWDAREVHMVVHSRVRRLQFADAVEFRDLLSLAIDSIENATATDDDAHLESVMARAQWGG